MKLDFWTGASRDRRAGSGLPDSEDLIQDDDLQA